jgi:hypothetical protein
MLPQDLQALLDQVDRCEAHAARLVADLDDEGVNWTPPAGGWSVAQFLTHLALMNEFYLRGWPDALAAAARAGRGPFKGLHPTPLGRWFIRYLEPPYRMKSQTISAATPAARVPRDTVLRDYTRSHERYRHLVRESAAVDVNRVVAPNAILKHVTMRLSTVLLIIPAHDRRHLWQAANVKALRR